MDRRYVRHKRRGSVLVLVIGILAMLFVMGATQLMVARFERRIIEEKGTHTAAKDAAIASTVSPSTSLDEDVVGLDAVGYNAAWNTSDTSYAEDASDFLGISPALGPGTLDAALIAAARRSGDLLLSSLEPYWDSVSRRLSYYALSWRKDSVLPDPDGDGALTLNELPSYPPTWTVPWVSDWPTSTGLNEVYADSDGDGILDSRQVGVMAGCDLYQRVVPHGGMVTLDPLTHPALLAQVIHPGDTYHARPWLVFDPDDGAQLTDADEARLRRRFMLAGSTPDWDALPSYDLRRFLPITLGYESPAAAYRAVTPHWFRVGMGPDPALSREWWEKRINPGYALTSGSYNSDTDMYDRRHLLTTRNSDDVLRPNRQESFLFGDPVATDPTAVPLRPFYYVLNPAGAPGPDLAGLQEQPAEAYGMIYPGAAASPSLVLNKDRLRTQFSLRDVLVDPTLPIADGGGYDGTQGYQASYRRAVQLTAYYLAMMHQTSGAPATEETRIRAAAQLAVNTIDFADNGDLNFNGVLDTGEVDPVTRFVYNANGVNIDVYGVERQPYITEAYAKTVVQSVEDPPLSGNFKWEVDVPLDKIFAVELYNPYDSDLVLDEFSLKVETGGALLSLAGIKMPPFSYVVVANTTVDKNYLAQDVHQDPFIPGAVTTGGYPEQNLYTISDLEIKEDDAVYLVRNRTLTISSVGLDPNGSEVTVDVIRPSGLPETHVIWARRGSNVDPTAAGQILVRDSSLQRRKELVPDTTVTTYSAYPPQYWQFTLSRQLVFPLAWCDEPSNTVSNIGTGYDRPPQHNLLLTSSFVNTMGPAPGVQMTNQEVVAAEFDGRKLTIHETTPPPSPFDLVAEYKDLPVAPFPVIVADRGLDLSTLTNKLDSYNAAVAKTIGTAAFPTTGTLLLVTKDGPASYNGASYPGQPLSELVLADNLYNINRGHLPAFDWGQIALDNSVGEGRFDMPWGQLVYSYFTALPLEELVWLDTNNFREHYYIRFGLNPIVERADADSPFGPRVTGRVNVNFAPWWVLDGLPVLPDAILGTTAPGPYATWAAIPSGSLQPVSGLPVSELLLKRLDPANIADEDERTGSFFLRNLIDESVDDRGLTTDRYPTLSPTMAQYMVYYREQNSADPDFAPANPGFLTPGALCDVAARIPMQAQYGGSLTGRLPLADIRAQWDPRIASPPVTAERPFTYIGYLHLVAPVVRLQDWATVRTHVYTIYNLVGDTNGTWLRSQTTIDRTRCLYTNDLPEKIVQTEPIDYFNTVGDQN